MPIDLPPPPPDVVLQELTASDAHSRASFGRGLSLAGDLDGDGLADLVVGSPAYDVSTELGSAGQIYVHPGSSSGVSSATAVALSASDAQAAAYFGTATATGGDLDGDGYDDLVVGAYRMDDGADDDRGAVYVYPGSASGVSTAVELRIHPQDWSGEPWLGYSLATGDVDGDGYDDLVAGAPQRSNEGTPKGGGIYVYGGSSSGLAEDAVSVVLASDWEREGYFGWAVDAGDVDGDGYDDVVVGARYNDGAEEDAGAVYLYLGSASGLDGDSEQRLSASDGTSDADYGTALSLGADFDGDGHLDLAVGAEDDGDLGEDAGAVYLYAGSTSGLDQGSEVKLTASDGAELARFGTAVAAGDFDGDGYGDLAVGAQGDQTVAWQAGAVYLYFGSASGLDPDSELKITVDGGAESDAFGHSLATGGDLDGDGCVDLVIGASTSLVGTNSGSAYVLSGLCEPSGDDGGDDGAGDDGSGDDGSGDDGGTDDGGSDSGGEEEPSKGCSTSALPAAGAAWWLALVVAGARRRWDAA